MGRGGSVLRATEKERAADIYFMAAIGSVLAQSPRARVQMPSEFVVFPLPTVFSGVFIST